MSESTKMSPTLQQEQVYVHGPSTRIETPRERAILVGVTRQNQAWDHRVAGRNG